MTKNSFSQNLMACLLAGIVGSIVMLRIGHRFLIDWIPFIVQIGVACLYFLTLIIIFLFRQSRTDKNKTDPQRNLAILQGLIRYFIALDLCMFGFQKIFHLQFAIPLGVLDNPFSSLSGEEMVWAFFGHFYAFTVIIAMTQITGSLMLLFRKTRLLAVIVLLPILLNILLLDWFYDLGLIVNIYITILTVAAVYLLLIEYDRLVKFFFTDRSALPQLSFRSLLWKNAIRFSVIIIPLLLMSLYKFPKYDAEIYGKYEVKKLVINNVVQNLTPCRDSILTKVFIDKTDLVFEYNNYQRRFIGNYTYNKSNRSIIAVWHYPTGAHDTLFADILPGKTSEFKTLKGHMGKETFTIDLLRVNVGN